jgi:hypothetical protein
LGNGVGEIIFQSGMSFKYVDAQLVRYIPEEDFLLLNRATPKEWETRLLVTLEPFQYLG